MSEKKVALDSTDDNHQASDGTSMCILVESEVSFVVLLNEIGERVQVSETIELCLNGADVPTIHGAGNGESSHRASDENVTYSGGIPGRSIPELGRVGLQTNFFLVAGRLSVRRWQAVQLLAPTFWEAIRLWHPKCRLQRAWSVTSTVATALA